jgi:hypothetical protein
MKKNIIFFVIVLTLLFQKNNILLNAKEREVPIGNQLQMLHKILSMETNLKKAKNVINIGVVFQSNNEISNATKKALFSFSNINVMTIGNAKLRFFPIDLSLPNNADIPTALRKNKCKILILTQLQSVDFKELTKYTQKNSILSFATNIETMISHKLSLAIGYKGNNNPQPFINQESVKLEGFNFPAQILKLSRIIN